MIENMVQALGIIMGQTQHKYPTRKSRRHSLMTSQDTKSLVIKQNDNNSDNSTNATWWLSIPTIPEPNGGDEYRLGQEVTDQYGGA